MSPTGELSSEITGNPHLAIICQAIFFIQLHWSRFSGIDYAVLYIYNLLSCSGALIVYTTFTRRIVESVNKGSV